MRITGCSLLYQYATLQNRGLAKLNTQAKAARLSKSADSEPLFCAY
ncbi:MAG: hypothetical protein LBU36_03030 [Clostridiales bacterium]|nr:hypothetical protein [Clostridiales bacterium]